MVVTGVRMSDQTDMVAYRKGFGNGRESVRGGGMSLSGATEGSG